MFLSSAFCLSLSLRSHPFPTWVYLLRVGVTLFPHSRDGPLSWYEHSGFTEFVYGGLVSSADLTILASGTLLELLGWVKIQLLVAAFSVLWGQPACQHGAKERDGQKRHIVDNKGWTLLPPILQLSPTELPCSVVQRTSPSFRLFNLLHRRFCAWQWNVLVSSHCHSLAG